VGSTSDTQEGTGVQGVSLRASLSSQNPTQQSGNEGKNPGTHHQLGVFFLPEPLASVNRMGDGKHTSFIGGGKRGTSNKPMTTRKTGMEPNRWGCVLKTRHGR